MDMSQGMRQKLWDMPQDRIQNAWDMLRDMLRGVWVMLQAYAARILGYAAVYAAEGLGYAAGYAAWVFWSLCYGISFKLLSFSKNNGFAVFQSISKMFKNVQQCLKMFEKSRNRSQCPNLVVLKGSR